MTEYYSPLDHARSGDVAVAGRSGKLPYPGPSM